MVYKSVQKSVPINQDTSIYQLRAKFELKANFNLSKFKLIHVQSGSDLMIINDNLKVFDHFGEEGLDNLLFELKPKDHLEQYYIKMFEQEYYKESNDKEPNQIGNNEKAQKNSKDIKDTILPNINQSQGKEKNTSIINLANLQDQKDVCFWDKKNRSTYICLKCRQEYCRECIKYDPHPQHLIEKSNVDSYCKVQRENYKKEIHDKILVHKSYKGIEKLDFILNDRLQLINEQFEEMVLILSRIKETQTKFMMDYFYQQFDNKKHKELNSDIDYFNGKYKEIETKYLPGNAFTNENLDNLKTLEKFKKLIIENYSDYDFRYQNFEKIFELYENFNALMINQFEGKLKASNNLRKKLSDPDKLEEELSQNDVKQKHNENFDSANFLFKVNNYNSISIFNTIKKTIKKELNFEDKSEFKINYQMYDGNLGLNKNGKYFVVTGPKFNMCYIYDPVFNRFSRFQDLKENYCRGGILAVEVVLNKVLRSFLLVACGKQSTKCEIMDISNIPINNPEKKEYDISTNKWHPFPSLNILRNQFGLYFYNERYIYAFFGINNTRGVLDTIERIDLIKFLEGDKSCEWEIVYYKNPKSLTIGFHSFAICRINQDEILILGGVLKDHKNTDKSFKFNFTHHTIYLNSFILPDLGLNEYFRFWEEPQMIPLKNNESVNDDFFYGIFDVKNKFHMINIKSYDYKIINI